MPSVCVSSSSCCERVACTDSVAATLPTLEVHVRESSLMTSTVLCPLLPLKNIRDEISMSCEA